MTRFGFYILGVLIISGGALAKETKSANRQPASIYDECGKKQEQKNLQYRELHMVNSQGIAETFVGFGESVQSATEDAVKKCSGKNDISLCEAQSTLGEYFSPGDREIKYRGLLAKINGCKKVWDAERKAYIPVE